MKAKIMSGEMNLGEVLGMMFSNRSDSEHDTVELVQACRQPLEGFCRGLVNNLPELDKIGTTLSETFKEAEEVHSSLRQEGISLAFYPKLWRAINNTLIDFVNRYVQLGLQYNSRVSGRLDDVESLGTEAYDSGSMRRDSNAWRAAKSAHNIIFNSIQNYITIKHTLPEMLKGVRHNFVSYDKYLKDRFIKPEDDKANKMNQMMMMIDRDEGPLAKYVKVRLYEGNPVMTDVLLNLIDALPEYKEIHHRKKKKGDQQITKTLSSWAVEDSAEKLSAVADPMMLKYITTPNAFFQKMAGAISDFYRVYSDLEDNQKRLLEQPEIQSNLSEIDMIRKVLREDNMKIEKELDRIKKIDLDGIVQDPDDVVPDNRTEKDIAELRTKLFTVLIDGLKDLSKEDDMYDRAEQAKQVVKKSVEIKDQMKDVGMTLKKRRLRQDKMSDNEYYVGRKGQVGQFYFERKPTPTVKMDDVIGKSFDESKMHLNEIIKTGTSARIMMLTAPGRKVRSNILLIGPYGCGKTELGRGVCGDERVIGASVSVANTLTAYMHESVSNVKRVYDEALELRDQARMAKPVALVLDEFNAWFARSGVGNYSDKDMDQIEQVFNEVLDGMEDYNGIITIAMTNRPLDIPHNIVRRFRYVDVVGQLTGDERKTLLSMNLEKSLPIAADVPEHYDSWVRQLENAPGDVVRKVADEVHFSLIPPFIENNPKVAQRLERVLYNREKKNGELSEKDVAYIKDNLIKHDCIATAEMVGTAFDDIMKRPNIKMQIEDARILYRDADQLLEEMQKSDGATFGFKPKPKLFDFERG